MVATLRTGRILLLLSLYVPQLLAAKFEVPADFFQLPQGPVITNRISKFHSRTGYLFAVTVPGLVTPLFPQFDCNKTHVTLADTDLVSQYKMRRLSVDSYIKTHKPPIPVPVATTAPVVIYANLCNAKIEQKKGAEIQNIDLTDADFVLANLDSVSFWGVPMYDADFTGASLEHGSFLNVDGDSRGYGSPGHVVGIEFVNFSGAKLTDAHIQWSNLKGADFYGARMEGAYLRESNFTEADFRSTDLRKAVFKGSNLKDAQFAGADLADATYEPDQGDVPDLASFSQAKHIDEITYDETPARLIELREALHQAGLNTAERAINYDINRVRNRRLREDGTFFEKLWSYLEFALLELPTSWGYHPGYALVLILVGIIICWPLYVFQLMIGNSVSTTGFIRVDLEGPVERRRPLLGKTSIRKIWWGLYVSVLSAFNIGWQGLNLKSWITRIQTKAFHIEAVGWVRTLSGIQALFSVYMLVMFLFTYFGRPFTE